MSNNHSWFNYLCHNLSPFIPHLDLFLTQESTWWVFYYLLQPSVLHSICVHVNFQIRHNINIYSKKETSKKNYMQGERVASVFAMIFYQNHTDWTCKHTLEGVTPWAAVRIFLWMTNSTLETHFFRPRQSAVLVNHARQHSTTFCSHLQHRICCFVSDGPPTERTVCSPPPQTLEWGLAHSQLSKLFCRLVNGTQPMGKSLTDNKACVSREPLQNTLLFNGDIFDI